MKKYKWIIWVVIIAAVAVGIWFWKFRPEKTVLVLETEHPTIGTLSRSVTATGTVQPVDTVSVGTQISGIIQKVYVDFNSTVKKGQLLAQLDKSLLQAQVSQINANLSSAKANNTFQQSNYERQQKLYSVGAISKAELESALYQYNSAKENVSSIAAQLNAAQKNLSFSDIYSPIDGTVLSRSVSEGQTVAASLSTPQLFSIAKDLTRMQVQASVDEADIGNVKTGQRVIFTVDAFPADTFGGTVKEVRLRSNVSSNVVTYTTIIDAPNAELKLKPGMTASITIYTEEIKDIMLVPAKALQFMPDSLVSKIYTVEGRGTSHKERSSPPASPDSSGRGTPGIIWVKKDSSLIMRPVITGQDDETQVQIIAGLSVTDEIVTGYKQTSKSKKTTTTEKSPFMPQRPNNRRSTGSGGGGQQGPPR